MKKPLLSIIVPTTGRFAGYWLDELLKIKGDVEFIIVYHPWSVVSPILDERVRQIICPLRGEIMQRSTGYLNAKGEYVFSINEDMFVHPGIVGLVEQHFALFPESWMLRPERKKVPFGETGFFRNGWPAIPDIAAEDEKILEVPIAPLDKKRFDPRLLLPFFERKDQHGAHMENSDKKIWRRSIVQESLSDLIQATSLLGPIKWIPFWALDRLLGLFIQAKYFQKDLVIGHWIKEPFLMVEMDNPPERSRAFRPTLLDDLLLLKRFPRYAYFWNLALSQAWVRPKRLAYHMGRILRGG